MTNNKKKQLVFYPIILFFCIIAGILYAKSLHSPFLFDDRPYILEDPAIRMTEISWSTIKTAAFDSRPKHRYLANISFALNYYFGKYNPTGYHITNIFIHALTGIILFFFFNTTLTRFPILSDLHTSTKSTNPTIVAFFSALLWLVFPVNTGAVTYIVQRMASLAALFYILSIWLYVLARISQQTSGYTIKTISYYIGFILAACCAVLTKENTGTLPFIILLYEWFFFQDLKISFSKRTIFYGTAAIAIFVVIAFHFLGRSPLDRILNSYSSRDFTLPERIMTEWRVIIYYISLLLWPSPSRLNLDHDFPLSSGLTSPATTVLSLIALLGLTAVAIYTARRHRLISFCIFWCLLNLVIESSVIGLEIIFEHRMYLPFMLFFLMFVLLAFKTGTRPHIPVAVLSILVLLFSVWTWQRNVLWSNPINFWNDNVKKSPQKPRPHLNLGNYYAKNGKYEQAVREFKTALSLNPSSKIKALLYNNLANALAQSGRLEDVPLYYFKALAMYPDYKAARANLQQIKNMVHRLSGPQNTQMKKKTAAIYNKTGIRLKNEGKFNEALLHFQTALVFQPDNPNLYYNIACTYSLKGQKKAAAAWLKEAIAHGYDDWEHITTDDDLKKIRDLPEVKSLIDKHAKMRE